MPTCWVCGDDGQLLHTCNHCGRKHCPEHQLPENHLCVPRKADIGHAAEASEKWFDEDYDRSNVMANRRQSDDRDSDSTWSWKSGEIDLENHGSSSDRGTENREPPKPLDADEIDADTESSPNECVRDVKQNREALDERLNRRDRNRSANTVQKPSSATPSKSDDSQSQNNSSTDTPSRIPGAIWVLILLGALIVLYVTMGMVI